MSEFNPERVNAAFREIQAIERKYAMYERPLQPPDRGEETPQELEARNERIEKRAAELLQDVAFVCEALSESKENALLSIGLLIFEPKTDPNIKYAHIGFYVAQQLKNYALKCATKETDNGAR